MLISFLWEDTKAMLFGKQEGHSHNSSHCSSDSWIEFSDMGHTTEQP
jgi:hypothetical protein